MMNYFSQVIAEMKQVEWPGVKKVSLYTIAVVVIALASAYILGLFDNGFAHGLAFIIDYI